MFLFIIPSGESYCNDRSKEFSENKNIYDAAETTQPAPQAQEAPGRGPLLAILAAALLLTAGAAWMLLHKQK